MERVVLWREWICGESGSVERMDLSGDWFYSKNDETVCEKKKQLVMITVL